MKSSDLLHQLPPETQYRELVKRERLEKLGEAGTAIGVLLLLSTVFLPGPNQWIESHTSFLRPPAAQAEPVTSSEKVFPLEGMTFADAPITSGYGYRDIGDGAEFHEGIDFGIPVGTEILAPEAGKISRIWVDGNGGGNVVELLLANGDVVKFLHLDSAAVVQEGQEVKAGDVIGLSGNTGRSTGPHLDIRIKSANGEWKDPTEYLASLGSGR